MNELKERVLYKVEGEVDKLIFINFATMKEYARNVVLARSKRWRVKTTFERWNGQAYWGYQRLMKTVRDRMLRNIWLLAGRWCASFNQEIWVTTSLFL